MKKFLIYFLLLVIPAASFSQSTPDHTPLVKADYLKKSHNQKTAAWVLLGGGGLLFTIGAVISANDVANDLGNIFNSNYQQSSDAGPILLVAGCITMLGSVPLFVASSKNYRRARTASAGLKMEKVPVIYQKSFVQNSYPALSLKINL